jgi:hypothetical protein
MFPADEHSPAASAIGAITYLDRTLTGVYAGLREHYRLGLRALDANAMQRFGQPVHACSGEQVDQLIEALQADTLADFAVPPQPQFFSMIFSHLQEGVFGDPAHGGNREMAGWRFLRPSRRPPRQRRGRPSGQRAGRQTGPVHGGRRLEPRQ